MAFELKDKQAVWVNRLNGIAPITPPALDTGGGDTPPPPPPPDDDGRDDDHDDFDDAYWGAVQHCLYNSETKSHEDFDGLDTDLKTIRNDLRQLVIDIHEGLPEEYGVEAARLAGDVQRVAHAIVRDIEFTLGIKAEGGAQ